MGNSTPVMGKDLVMDPTKGEGPNQPISQMALIFCLLLLIISSATACDRCVHQSKVAYFSDDSALSSGACGYGSLATTFYGGNLAAATPSIYKDGAGCGACFQIICKDTNLCSKEGTIVIVTDLNNDKNTDFVISRGAFMSMANKGMEQEVLKLGIADVEYKRIPCDYKRKNLAVRVEESSQKPNYLAVKFLYQGGQTEIFEVDVAPAAAPANWGSMSRNHGAIWDTSRVPSGALEYRFGVTQGYDGAMYYAKSVLPADWKVGEIYDLGFQIDAIAQESCSKCDDGHW